MKLTAAVALSGGLDSAVAAAILKKEGHRVLGFHFKTGYEQVPAGTVRSVSKSRIPSCVQQVAEQIGIPLSVLDFSEAFEKEVIQYFVHAYRCGQTPNPCMVCNERIKFGLVLDSALALGASHMATGHYARIRAGADGRFFLLKGIDRVKDQSYFLARLGQNHLSRAIFPLGKYTKDQVREMAQAWGLSACHGRESQELCFVKDDSYKAFLSRSGGLSSQPGPIETTEGRKLGVHQGLHNYTVGQRQGINIPGPAPYYVLRLDDKRNRLVVGSKSELAAAECLVTQINWIDGEPPEEPISVSTRIRYRHREADSTLTVLDRHTATVRFAEAQDAITPGQAAVFYEGERVLGGGWIAR
jgi:tRNA-specific 2-thiouridylase